MNSLKKKLKWFVWWILKKALKDSRFIKQHILDTFRKEKCYELALKPIPCDNYVQWLGHSSILIKIDGITILADPIFSSRIGPILFGYTIGPKRYIKPFIPECLNSIDILMISHAHFDHWDIPTLINLPPPSLIIIPSNTLDLLPNHLKPYAKELNSLEQLDVTINDKLLKIIPLECEHPGARLRKDDHRGVNSYLIIKNNIKLLFVGDTSVTKRLENGYKNIFPNSSPIDLAFFPISAYNPYVHNHCTPEEALFMSENLHVKTVIPIHHSTFKLSKEPLKEPIQRFLKVETKVKKVLLKVGETLPI
jgi:L-ascorbate metabolism protein UlaG (beta-lactamase superfamily)